MRTLLAVTIVLAIIAAPTLPHAHMTVQCFEALMNNTRTTSEWVYMVYSQQIMPEDTTNQFVREMDNGLREVARYCIE